MRLLHPLIILIIAIGGLLGGYMIGKHRTELEFEKLFYLGEANSLTSRVQALSILRHGQSEKASEVLEHLIDGNLIIMGPYKETALKENNTVILSSLKLASLYREIYSNKDKLADSENIDINKSINETLEFGRKHGEFTHMDFIEQYLNPNKAP